MVTLYVGLTRQNVLFLIPPAKLPGPDGRTMATWHRSLHEAMSVAMEKWIRMEPNMGLGAYEIAEALNQTGDPKWPDLQYARNAADCLP